MRLAKLSFAIPAATCAAVCAASLFSASTPPVLAAQPPTAVTTAPRPAGFGTIKGRLVWGGKDIPAPVPITKNKGVTFCTDFDLVKHAYPVDPKTKGVGSAFAYVVKPKGKNPEAETALLAKSPTVLIDNKDCEFVPYSTALFQKQQVVFASQDDVGHNAHYTGFNQGKNVVLVPKGKVVSKLQVESRPITLACDIHPWMEGRIMVFDHPFFAVTGTDGSFEITGVPEGDQKLAVRLSDGTFITESAGKTVSVKAGGTSDVGEITVEPTKIKK